MSRALDEAHRDQWHPANDPPDTSRFVLSVSVGDTNPAESYFTRGEWFVCGYPCTEITYWREMPEGPRKEEK